MHGADDRANACPPDGVDVDALIMQRLYRADMRKTARAAS